MESNTESTDLSSFLSKLQTRPPTPNMLNWMRYYSIPCSKLCCHSIDCGCIRCSSCGVSLTKLPPSTRFQCIECPILLPEAPFDPRPTFCWNCFINDKCLHFHKKWLKVDEKGIHSIIFRDKGICDINILDLNKDFISSDKKKEGDCYICSEPFEKNNPAIKFPGCKGDHGTGVLDKFKGMIDSGEYAHGYCLIKWYETCYRGTYCGEANYCDICNFEEEMKGWKRDFIEARKKLGIIEKFTEFEEICGVLSIVINKAEVENKEFLEITREKLMALHKQEWIRTLIKEIFI